MIKLAKLGVLAVAVGLSPTTRSSVARRDALLGLGAASAALAAPRASVAAALLDNPANQGAIDAVQGVLDANPFTRERPEGAEPPPLPRELTSAGKLERVYKEREYTPPPKGRWVKTLTKEGVILEFVPAGGAASADPVAKNPAAAAARDRRNAARKEPESIFMNAETAFTDTFELCGTSPNVPHQKIWM